MKSAAIVSCKCNTISIISKQQCPGLFLLGKNNLQDISKVMLHAASDFKCRLCKKGASYFPRYLTNTCIQTHIKAKEIILKVFQNVYVPRPLPCDICHQFEVGLNKPIIVVIWNTNKGVWSLSPVYNCLMFSHTFKTFKQIQSYKASIYIYVATLP